MEAGFISACAKTCDTEQITSKKLSKETFKQKRHVAREVPLILKLIVDTLNCL